MENWREYQEKEELKEVLLEDLDYVTGVLGIQIPLDESDNPEFTDLLREEILAEHLLYEGFKEWAIAKAREAMAVVQTAASKGKEKAIETATDVKNLFVSLYKIVRDKTNIDLAIKLLDTELMTPIANKLKEFFDVVMNNPLINKIGKTLMNALGMAKSMFDKLVGFFIDMPSSWKKALFGAALTVGLVWIWDKFKDKILKALTGDVLDIQAWFGDFWNMFKGKLSGMGNQVMSVVADVEKYVGYIIGVGGTILFVASALAPVTKQLALGNPAEEVPPGTPIK